MANEPIQLIAKGRSKWNNNYNNNPMVEYWNNKLFAAEMKTLLATMLSVHEKSDSIIIIVIAEVVVAVAVDEMWTSEVNKMKRSAAAIAV